MSNGGRKYNEMHTAHRYRDIPCRSCGAEFLAYGQRMVCDDCKAAKRQTPEEMQKRAAQRAVVWAVRTGKLVRQPCQECAAASRKQLGTSHGHHEDYSKPLDVLWLCSFHHIKRHDEISAGIPLSESHWITISHSHDFQPEPSTGSKHG